ncbi:hypothetical protein ACOQFV_22930 [Nocardiopsis changdeensis]|uniref:Uncharacterized protein n=1 Tax=Nocardiopsis changdeensis TaxID=2831969 RepID=A0ABX8BIB7_9ACTN|nr:MULTISPECIES: hypothetical protein [Nocardiopsis]QUX21961.1 hypothetical protein KGD84_26935 [Nocardiopsis changdeensis]QYX37898.1 hypothetical protein K1J57_04330 [Nocardiopsis sp. MT53]
MPNPLPERAQRFVFIGLIVVLVGAGVYFSTGGFGGGGGAEAPAEPEVSQGENGGSAGAPDALSSVEPSPLPTTAADDVDVLEWFPFPEEDLRTAGTTAKAFAEAYGTIDYTGSPEAYYDSMRALATDEYADVLAESSRAGAFWTEMAEAEAIAEGRAEVRSIRTFGDSSITFVVTAQSITETANREFDEELGEFAITVVQEGRTWRVFDFQPADVGQFGEE